MRLLTTSIVILLAVGLTAAQDKLHLKDGQVVVGKIVSVTDGDVQIQTDEETMRVPRWAVERIERAGQARAAANAAPAAPRRGPARRGRPGGARGLPEETPELLAWVDTCVANLGTADEGVRTSVSAALRAAGPVALPALKRVAEGDDPDAARVAESLTEYLDRIAERAAQPTRQERVQGQRVDGLVHTLKLTEEQEPQFREIFGEYHKNLATLTAKLRGGEIESEDAGEHMQRMKNRRDDALAKVLDEEQMAQYRKTVSLSRER